MIAREIRAGVDHLGIEEERVERIREIVVIVHVLLVGRFAAVGPGLVAANLLERPGAAARHQQEPGRGRQHEALVERLQGRLGGDLGPARHQIEDRAVADVEARAHPEIGEGIDVRAAHQRGDGAFIRDRDGELRGAELRRNGRAVPQHEADVEREALAHMREQPPQAIEALDRPIHFRWTM
jgi:hypothetical protein